MANLFLLSISERSSAATFRGFPGRALEVMRRAHALVPTTKGMNGSTLAPRTAPPAPCACSAARPRLTHRFWDCPAAQALLLSGGLPAHQPSAALAGQPPTLRARQRVTAAVAAGGRGGRQSA